MSSVLRMEDQGAVVQVVLNRPDKRNALDVRLFEAIIQAQQTLADRQDLRVVILRGEGAAFCAGLDLGTFAGEPALANTLLKHVPGTDVTVAQQVAVGWRSLSVPVIAVLHGQVFGGGLQIALGADLRIAAPDTQLSIMESRWGLIPDMGATTTLQQLLRIDQVLELTYSARVLGAEEALQLGLVTRVVADPLAAALELAHGIVAKSPDAIAGAKRLFFDTWYAEAGAGLGREAELQRLLVGSANQVEAVRAHFEKRAPNFTTE
jgi:enoyl-CoA hydratase/carnithine racemase